MSGWVNPKEFSSDDLADLQRLLDEREPPKIPPNKFASNDSPALSTSDYCQRQVKQEYPQPQRLEGSPVNTPETPRKRRRKSADEDPEQYSERAREEALSSKTKRTRQACDRCKVRRLRCDSDVQGCLSCRAANLPCQVTDVVTGDTCIRGEVGRLKETANELEEKVKALDKENTRLSDENEHLHIQLNYYQQQLQLFQQPFQVPEVDQQKQSFICEDGQSNLLGCTCQNYATEYCPVHGSGGSTQ